MRPDGLALEVRVRPSLLKEVRLMPVTPLSPFPCIIDNQACSKSPNVVVLSHRLGAPLVLIMVTFRGKVSMESVNGRGLLAVAVMVCHLTPLALEHRADQKAWMHLRYGSDPSDTR